VAADAAVAAAVAGERADESDGGIAARSRQRLAHTAAGGPRRYGPGLQTPGAAALSERGRCAGRCAAGGGLVMRMERGIRDGH
jgi:hypothetical protein